MLSLQQVLLPFYSLKDSKKYHRLITEGKKKKEKRLLIINPVSFHSVKVPAKAIWVDAMYSVG